MWELAREAMSNSEVCQFFLFLAVHTQQDILTKGNLDSFPGFSCVCCFSK